LFYHGIIKAGGKGGLNLVGVTHSKPLIIQMYHVATPLIIHMLPLGRKGEKWGKEKKEKGSVIMDIHKQCV